MEHFTSPDIAVAFGAFFIVIVAAVLVGAPFAAYRTRMRTHHASWSTTKPTLLLAGAYRGMIVELPHRVAIPRVVIAASLMTFYMVVPSLALFPFIVVGAGSEIASQSVGPAIVFGAPGIALAMASTRIGARLLRREALPPRASLLPIAQLLFAFALTAMVALCTLMPPENAWKTLIWKDTGALVFCYIVAVSIHACLLHAGMNAHARATIRHDEAHDQR